MGRKTFSEGEEIDKTDLSRACVAFLKSVSRWPDLRETNLRSKRIGEYLIDVLLKEDELHSYSNPDIEVEGTWTGRSLENLLQCLAGKDRLKSRQKVAYRVINRIADVLEGRSDITGGKEPEERSCQDMGLQERKMFDEARVKRDLKKMNGVELSDRATQQQVFAAFNGLDRLAAFLTDLY